MMLRKQFVALAALLLLVSCGGDDEPKRNVEQVVSFGDSLSDVGSYRWGSVQTANGGKYTTNPGPIWVERIASYYGTGVTRNRTGGTGNPGLVEDGSGYAQGGARVTQLPGVGQTPSPTAGVPVEAAALPVVAQITNYLNATGGRVGERTLFLMLAGANDVLFQLGVFTASVTAGVSLATAQATALTAMQAAGTELAQQVRRLTSVGANKVVVVNLPNLADTPFGAAQTADARALIGAMTQAFNTALATGLSGAGVQSVDLGAFLTDARGDPVRYGFVNVNTPACNFPTANNPASIFCTSATLNAVSADQNYLFADAVHPTAGGHAQFAQYVLDRIGAAIPR